MEHSLHDINKYLKPEKEYEWNHWDHKELCDELDYKYLIAIDGWVSGWFRGPSILQSNSVPIVV